MGGARRRQPFSMAPTSWTQRFLVRGGEDEDVAGFCGGGGGDGTEELEVDSFANDSDSVSDSGFVLSVCSICSVCSAGFEDAPAEDDDENGSVAFDEDVSSFSSGNGSFSVVCNPSLQRSSSTSLARKERQSS